MNAFTKQLIRNSDRPETSHLKDIKMMFKSNGRLINRINSIVDLVMSSLFLFIFFTISEDLFSAFEPFIAYLPQSIAAYIKESRGEVRDMPAINHIIRFVSINFLSLALKIALIVITVLQIKAVNHESISAPIHLTDFFTQFHHLIEPDLYRSVSFRQ